MFGLTLGCVMGWGVGGRGGSVAVFLGNPKVKTFIVDRGIGSSISKGS